MSPNMKCIRHLRINLAAGAIALLPAFAVPASAAMVGLEGSFQAFQGPVAYPPGSPEHTSFGPSYINNVQVDPTSPTSRPGVGFGNVTFAPGTTSIEFRNEGEIRNLLAFTAAPPQDVSPGQEFRIGTFTLENGSWFGGLGEGDAMFSFEVSTVSTDPALNGHVFSDVIRYQITQFGAGNTPQDNADFFSFVGRSDLGGMSVYERLDSPTGSNAGSIDLYGRIGSLVPTTFANAQGGAFISPPIAVPEPLSCLATAVALGVLGCTIRLRRHTQSGTNS